MVRKRTSRACVSPNERNICSCSAVNGRELSTTRSAPRSDRAWSSIACARLARNNPIAIRAATPNEIEMEKSRSRHRLERLSRQAMRGMKAKLLVERPIVKLMAGPPACHPDPRRTERDLSCNRVFFRRTVDCSARSLAALRRIGMTSRGGVFSFDHLSVAQPDRPLRQARDVGIVRHEDERGARGCGSARA